MGRKRQETEKYAVLRVRRAKQVQYFSSAIRLTSCRAFSARSTPGNYLCCAELTAVFRPLGSRVLFGFLIYNRVLVLKGRFRVHRHVSSQGHDDIGVKKNEESEVRHARAEHSLFIF